MLRIPRFVVLIFFGYAATFFFLYTVFRMSATSHGDASQGGFYEEGADGRTSGKEDGKGLQNRSDPGSRTRPQSRPPEKMQVKPSPRQEGQFETRYLRGNKSLQWEFREGRRSGMTRIYYPTGPVWCEIPFKDGQRDGVERWFYPGGRIQMETPFQQGKRQGSFRLYYPDGAPWMEQKFEGGMPASIPKLFSQAGEEVTRGLMAPFKVEVTENSTGSFKAYSADGKPRVEWSASTAAQEAITSKYADGSISARWPLQEGRLEGRVEFYYPDGQIWQTWEYAGGEIRGLWRMYFPGGALFYEVRMEESGEEGEALRTYPSGTLWTSEMYEDGRLTGNPKAYSEKGA